MEPPILGRLGDRDDLRRAAVEPGGELAENHFPEPLGQRKIAIGSDVTNLYSACQRRL